MSYIFELYIHILFLFLKQEEACLMQYNIDQYLAEEQRKNDLHNQHLVFHKRVFWSFLVVVCLFFVVLLVSIVVMLGTQAELHKRIAEVENTNFKLQNQLYSFEFENKAQFKGVIRSLELIRDNQFQLAKLSQEQHQELRYFCSEIMSDVYTLKHHLPGTPENLIYEFYAQDFSKNDEIGWEMVNWDLVLESVGKLPDGRNVQEVLKEQEKVNKFQH